MNHLLLNRQALVLYSAKRGTLASANLGLGVNEFFSHYPINRSCGQDGLSTALLRGLRNSNLCDHIAKLFKLITRIGKTPSRWNKNVTYPLAKMPKSTTINNFRPITLTSIIRRCYERILHEGIH